MTSALVGKRSLLNSWHSGTNTRLATTAFYTAPRWSRIVKYGKCAVVLLCPRQKTDASDDDCRVDYTNLMIVRGSLPLADARGVIEGIVEQGLMNLPQCPSVPIAAYLEANMIRR